MKLVRIRKVHCIIVRKMDVTHIPQQYTYSIIEHNIKLIPIASKVSMKKVDWSSDRKQSVKLRNFVLQVGRSAAASPPVAAFQPVLRAENTPKDTRPALAINTLTINSP